MKALFVLAFLAVCVGLIIIYPPLGIGLILLAVVFKILTR